MAYDGKPSTWVTGWSEDGTDITIPIASLTDLTAVEADGTSGDIRNCLLAILETAAAHFASLPTADRPTKMTISKNVQFNSATNLYTHAYSFSFTCSAGDVNVVPEV